MNKCKSYLYLHLPTCMHTQASKICSSITNVVQLPSHVQLFDPSCSAAHQASLSFIISQSLLKVMSIKSVMPFIHLILCHPLLLLPSIFPNIMVFSKELALHFRCPKYQSFSFSPSNEYSGLISFRIDWLDLLAVEVNRAFLAALKQFLVVLKQYFIKSQQSPFWIALQQKQQNSMSIFSKLA